MKINDWFVGVVEDVNDPDSLGRVRVRSLGFHTPDRTDLPTEDLHWSTCIMPVTNAAQGGIGTSATGMLPGTWVFGFYRDGLELQDSVVLGTIASASGFDVGFDVTGNIGFGDPHGLFSNHVGSDMPGEAAGNGNSAWNSVNSSVDAVPTPNDGTPITSFDAPPSSSFSPSGDVGQALINTARSQIGVVETSHNQGAGIEKYWSATGYKSGYSARAPYCAAFVSWVVKQSGALSENENPNTASAFGLIDWARGKPYTELRMNPRFIRAGDIMVMAKSHAGIASTNSDSNGIFKSIDGNTGIGGGREGVGEKNRNLSIIRAAITIKPTK